MKSKKGFTLIELITILALIAIIAAFSFQVVSSRIRKSKELLKDSLYIELKDAANKYLLANPDYDKYKTSRLCIKISTLQNNGFLENGPIKNPVTNDSLLGYYIKAEYDNDSKQYKYDVLQTCTADETLTVSDYLIENQKLVVTSGDGLYEDTDSYVYKGINPNNHVKFSDDNTNEWRIVSIDKETKYVKLIRTSSTINGVPSGGIISYLNDSYDTSNSYTSYQKAIINSNSKWYTGALNSSTHSPITIKSLEKQNNDYQTIGLLSVSEYLNSSTVPCYQTNNCNTYLSRNTNYFLLNKTSSGSNWYVNSSNKLATANDSAATTFLVYPVIYLNLKARIMSGTGSSSLPYIIGKY